MTEQDYFEKKCQKWSKWDKKQTRFCGLFKKIKSLVLPGIAVKRKFLWSFNILQKTAYIGKIWLSIYYGQKWLSANEISVFFNRQYFINRLISDFDFWNVADWHE